MRWLLLSDIHLGIKNQSQELALDSLVSALASAPSWGAFDFVLIAGDLAYSGVSEEYKEVTNKLIRPLRELPTIQDAPFIAVPGNHDVDCDKGYPPTIAALGKSMEYFFHLDERGRRLREPTAGRFSSFSEFLLDAEIDGVDPTKEPAAVVHLRRDNDSINVVCIVTSYFSSKHIMNERQNVPRLSMRCEDY